MNKFINKTIILSLVPLILISCSSKDLSPEPPTVVHTSEEALEDLISGNKRFFNGQMKHPHETPAFREILSHGQHPEAAILTCSDSRVAPEIIFDVGLGDLFTIRVAGNIVDDAVLGSLEYAVEHLHVPLIIVLGHSDCGAIKATLAGGEPKTHIQSLCSEIQASGVSDLDDTLEHAISSHILSETKKISQSEPILKEALSQGKVKVVSALYHLENGQVEFLSEKSF
jgi:carbonic anhydrase